MTSNIKNPNMIFVSFNANNKANIGLIHEQFNSFTTSSLKKKKIYSNKSCFKF